MGAYSAGYGLGSAYRRNPAPAPAGFPRATGQATISRYNPPDPTHPTLPVTETWTGSDADPWPPTRWITYGGTATIQSNSGQLTTPAGGYDGSLAQLIAMPVVADVEVLVDFTAVSTGVEQYPQVALRCDARHSATRPTVGYSAFMCYAATPASGFIQVERQNGGSTVIGTQPSFTFTGGVTYRCRFKAVGADLYLKVWDASTAEPGSWTWTHTDTSPYLSAGQVYVGMGNGADGIARSARFDDLTVSAGTVATIPTGSGTGSWLFTGSGTGARAPKGSGTGTWTFAGTGSGKRTPKASGSGTFTFTGTGAGKRTPKATGVGSLTFTGAGSGTTTRRGTGTGAAAWTGAGAGTATRRGIGTGSWSFVGSGTGATVRQGTGSGTATWTGAGSGSAPGIGPSEGSGTGSWGFTGAGAGTRTSRGAGTGLATWVGTGEGTAPALAVHSGSGSGTWAYAGAGSGITGSALRDITLTVGPGRSRTLGVTAAARSLTAVGAGSRTVTATGTSRELAAAGASRTLTTEPLE